MHRSEITREKKQRMVVAIADQQQFRLVSGSGQKQTLKIDNAVISLPTTAADLQLKQHAPENWLLSETTQGSHHLCVLSLTCSLCRNSAYRNIPEICNRAAKSPILLTEQPGVLLQCYNNTGNHLPFILAPEEHSLSNIHRKLSVSNPTERIPTTEVTALIPT